MKLYAFLIIPALTFIACKKTNSDSQTPVTPVNPPKEYKWLFASTAGWSDEFSADGLPDPLKWGYDAGGNGWGNNELQYYTNGDNVVAENGILKITARKESLSNREYTSTRLVTRNKADWLYGRIEVKAKLPKGRGTWPAIWMLPVENAYGTWPKSGEIDIMEHVGYDPNIVHFTVHTEAFNHMLGTQVSKNLLIPTATEIFHTYRVDWTPYGIRGYFDDVKVFEFMKIDGSRTWPFDKKFYLIMNIAVGGSWGGAQGIDDNVFPAVLEVDYVKAYPFIE